MATNSNQTGGGQSKDILFLTIQGKLYEWREQYITGLQVKQLGGISLQKELYLSVIEPWKDELITDTDKVDLAREGIEQFYVKEELRYTIDQREFTSDKQYIRGAQIRKNGNVPPDFEIFLSIKGPWEDELIKDDDWVDLARPGIEHFYSKAVSHDIVLIVNATEKQWNKRMITFDEVVLLAFPDSKSHKYTVGYDRGPKENPDGTMVQGEEVFVKNKMIFNVTPTNKS